MRIAAAQARPVWLDRDATTAKACELIGAAAREGAALVAFPETFLSGYPVWIRHGDGAGFEDPLQRAAYAQYLESAVEQDGPQVRDLCAAAADNGVFVYIGVSERGARAARGTVYCTLLAIDPRRGVVGAHRKLVPTHRERMVWGRGDGHGLRTHEVGGLRVGGLSCWENWMPQARHALYADGEELHVATWPGWIPQTADITRFVAIEGRVAVLSVAGLLSPADIPDDFALAAALRARPDAGGWFDGGSAVAAPDGRWLVEPVAGEERLVVADIDPAEVRGARLAADPTGHYGRPDVFSVTVDRRRQVTGADGPVGGG
ncbi:MAG: carbon-nitrogen hydrolase family protein [Thermoleophilia bacterium]